MQTRRFEPLRSDSLHEGHSAVPMQVVYVVPMQVRSVSDTLAFIDHGKLLIINIVNQIYA
jgi:hypothetical protein